MSCEKFLIDLEEYVEGDLDQESVIKLEKHLSFCASCSNSLEQLQKEQLVYSSYKREVDITPELWNRVVSQIREERQEREAKPFIIRRLFAIFSTPRLSLAFTAAAVSIAVITTIVVMQKLTTNPVSTSPEVVKTKEYAVDVEKNKKVEESEKKISDVVASKNVNREKTTSVRHIKKSTKKIAPTAEQLLFDAEKKYLAAISILERDAKNHRSQLDAETLMKFDKTIAAIDQSILETRVAVRKQPNDPVAVQYMLTAYAKKVEILREIVSY